MVDHWVDFTPSPSPDVPVWLIALPPLQNAMVMMDSYSDLISAFPILHTIPQRFISGESLQFSSMSLLQCRWHIQNNDVWLPPANEWEEASNTGESQILFIYAHHTHCKNTKSVENRQSFPLGLFLIWSHLFEMPVVQ